MIVSGGTCCASDLSFKVDPGKPLIVTGPNASGKSSLFRMIGGLWEIQAGSIDRPCDQNTNRLTPEHVFLVPQKPYSVRGSLADQITYPKKVPPEDRTPEMEAQLFAMLKLVQVEYLARQTLACSFCDNQA